MNLFGVNTGPCSIRHYRTLLASVLVFLCGCGVTPTPSFPDHPDRWLHISGFELAVFENRKADGMSLHVYLDGDGRPVTGPDFLPASDSTPDNALVLELMRRDEAPAVYLGRPCHFNPGAEACSPELWTTGRYSPVIVNALCDAVEQLAARADKTVVLVGFSGGGALAILTAGCAGSVSRVVTINGNLDTALWARLRGFQPLVGSLNPRDVGLPNRVTGRFYLVGGQDKVVPPEVSQSFEVVAPGHLITVPDYAHTCCWLTTWPKLLNDTLNSGSAQ